MVIEPLEAYDALELLPLYAAVGWTNYTARPEMLERAFGRAPEDGRLSLPGVVSRKMQMIPPLRLALNS